MIQLMLFFQRMNSDRDCHPSGIKKNLLVEKNLVRLSYV